MSFSHIIGNESVKNYLTSMFQRDAIAQSLLFSGPEGIGKSLFAEAFAKLILCRDDPEGHHRYKCEAHVHPDLHIYRPEGKIGMHSIDSMRQFSEEVNQSPFEAKRKVFIIHDANRMLTYSANALLKTFEEPAPHSIIILLSSAPEALLPTVLSRCRTIRFQPISEIDIAKLLMQRFHMDAGKANGLAKMSQGSVGRAFRLAEHGKDPMREHILGILGRGRRLHYPQLLASVKEISALIESEQKQFEESAHAEMRKSYPDGLTSIQQHALEKEIEGALAMRQSEKMHGIMDTISIWYRDMHLMHVNGNREYLLHQDYAAEIEQALQRGEMISLKAVQAAIGQANLALARSTPIAHCLETLLLVLSNE